MRGATATLEGTARAKDDSGEVLLPLGTRIEFGDSGEGRVTARDGARVFIESPEYTGWVDEAWFFAQCRPMDE